MSDDGEFTRGDVTFRYWDAGNNSSTGAMGGPVSGEWTVSASNRLGAFRGPLLCETGEAQSPERLAFEDAVTAAVARGWQ